MSKVPIDLRNFSAGFQDRTSLARVLYTNTLSGKSLVTSDPEPTTVFSPMLSLSITVTVFFLLFDHVHVKTGVQPAADQYGVFHRSISIVLPVLIRSAGAERSELQVIGALDFIPIAVNAFKLERLYKAQSCFE